MLPMILGYAMSIHRLQGDTMGKVILNPGETKFPFGLLLVGATRTKTFEGLAFTSPFPNFICFAQKEKPGS
jgi:ATP-dependent exoDNAse (exonuclease V) alpha subunit